MKKIKKPISKAAFEIAAYLEKSKPAAKPLDVLKTNYANSKPFFDAPELASGKPSTKIKVEAKKQIDPSIAIQATSIFTAINLIADTLPEVMAESDMFEHELKYHAKALLQSAIKIQEVLNKRIIKNNVEACLQYRDEASMKRILEIMACILPLEREVMAEMLEHIFISPEVVSTIEISEYIAIVNKKNSIITTSAKIIDRNQNLKKAREAKRKKSSDKV